jgi:hypothetical protein
MQEIEDLNKELEAIEKEFYELVVKAVEEFKTGEISKSVKDKIDSFFINERGSSKQFGPSEFFLKNSKDFFYIIGIDELYDDLFDRFEGEVESISCDTIESRVNQITDSMMAKAFDLQSFNLCKLNDVWIIGDATPAGKNGDVFYSISFYKNMDEVLAPYKDSCFVTDDGYKLLSHTPDEVNNLYLSKIESRLDAIKS